MALRKIIRNCWNWGNILGIDVPERLLDGVGDVVEVDIDEMSATLEC